MVIDNIKENLKFVLSGTFVFAVCFFLHAEEAKNNLIYYGTSNIVGKEYLIFEGTTSPVVSPRDVKKAVKAKKEAPAPVENIITEQKPISVVFPSLPTPSSQSFFQDNSESAVISPHQRPGKQQLAAICCQKNICRASVNNSDVSLYQAEQRQKLSIAATQCGMFTSFASQSPPQKRLSSRA